VGENKKRKGAMFIFPRSKIGVWGKISRRKAPCLFSPRWGEIEELFFFF